jgi:hypothetical protein
MSFNRVTLLVEYRRQMRAEKVSKRNAEWFLGYKASTPETKRLGWRMEGGYPAVLSTISGSAVS